MGKDTAGQRNRPARWGIWKPSVFLSVVDDVMMHAVVSGMMTVVPGGKSRSRECR